MEQQEFNAPKFDALVHFIIAESGDPKQLGATKLNKILWFTDKFSYWETGKTITGASYLKRQYGPVPTPVLDALKRLEAAGKIKIKDPEERYQIREFTSLKKPDMDQFSREEIALASAVIDQVCHHTAEEISSITHDEVWKAAEIGEEIPFEATLFSTTTKIPDDVKSWAQEHIGK